jgi:hypothetical protein
MGRRQWVTIYIHRMNYNINILYKTGLNSNILKSKYKILPKICTHRPSLSSKDEISRNKVDVIEIASSNVSYIMNPTYTKNIVISSYSLLIIKNLIYI